MSKDELWDEYTVFVYRDDIKSDIPLCGLCGNSGMLNTLATAKWYGKEVGVFLPCICPNGRSIKKMK